MTYIKINLTEANEYVKECKKNKKDYYDSISTIYASLENIDACWSDYNTEEFKTILRKDKIKVFDYFDSLDTLYANLEQYNNDIINILSYYGYSNKNKLLLKFDDEQLESCKSRLSNVIYYLNQAISKINNNLLNSDYSNKQKLYDIKSKMNKAIDLVEDIKSNVSKFDNSISNSVSSYNEQIKNIDGLELGISEIKYNGNLVDLN